MGLFGKKTVDTPQTRQLNELLDLALEMDQSTGTWHVLPDTVTAEQEEQVITARKMIFEYIRQLKMAGVYSHGAVHKFAKQQYSWVNKQNLQKFTHLGQWL